jgi:hypothetical protein
VAIQCDSEDKETKLCEYIRGLLRVKNPNYSGLEENKITFVRKKHYFMITRFQLVGSQWI